MLNFVFLAEQRDWRTDQNMWRVNCQDGKELTVRQRSVHTTIGQKNNDETRVV